MAKKTESTMDHVRQEEIARCAYDLWEREGRPEGRSTEHWLQAELLVRDRLPKPAAAAESRPRKQGSATSSRREKRFEMVS